MFNHSLSLFYGLALQLFGARRNEDVNVLQLGLSLVYV